jgi:hypothetical protein
MKNQYFGDINDYRKYGILRALQSQGNFRVLVAWMLTNDDGGPDGRNRSYLRNPATWKRYDPALFSGLADLMLSTRSPRVSLMHDAALLANTAYFQDLVPDGRDERETWRRRLLDAAKNADLVFLDPDNGIEVPSKPIGRKDSSKYVAWQEIESLAALGCSTLIYQHYRRESREVFVKRIVSELRRRTGARYTQAFRTAHVSFLLAAQARHEAGLRDGISLLQEQWHGQLDPTGFVDS